MDTLGFLLKRADQRMLAFQRALLRPLRPLGLTPARYVLLFLVSKSEWKVKRNDRYRFQSNIWRSLGVSPVTVCKMLQSLERLELVTRVRHFNPDDKRQVAVFITPKGRSLLRIVDRAYIRPGVLWIAAHTIFGKDAGRVGRISYMLDELRKGLLDTAGFHYPLDDRTRFPERKHDPPPKHVWPRPIQ